MKFQSVLKKWTTLGLLTCMPWGYVQAQTVDSYPQSDDSSAQAASNKSGHALSVRPSRVLAAVAHVDEVLQMRRGQDRTIGQASQIGIRRNLPALKSSQDFASQLVWVAAADGSLHASLEFTSEDAVAMRLMMDIEKIDPSVMLRFYRSTQDTQPVEISGAEILDAIALNRKATTETSSQALQRHLNRQAVQASSEKNSGNDNSKSDVYVGPMIEGQTTILSIALPAGQQPNSLKINIPSISHLYISPVQPDDTLSTKAAASCNINVNCYSDWTQNPGNAVARMVYSDAAGYSYACTGTLLADAARSGTPYFYTAAHCINTQFAATSLINVWFYRSQSCGVNTLASNYKVQGGGSTLLYTTQEIDATLLRLNTASPSGTVFSGWSASLPAMSTDVVGVHHPAGDVQKITFSRVSGYDECTLFSGGSVTCSPTSSSSLASHIRLQHTSGVTEGGSSGSGIFQTIGTGKYLVGQLTGGSSSCQNNAGMSIYGRFDRVYPAIKQWLNP